LNDHDESLAPRGVWSRNFFLLWQGQLVSAVGDIVYSIALGFWILEKTGSTALMGTLMAATALPRFAGAPFAGVVVDRINRKSLLIAMDVARGIAVVLVGAAALGGGLRVWMVFAAGIVIGIGGAFFSPGVSAVLPSLVPKDRLIQANSAYALIYTGSGLLGNSAGGFLFQLIGAPLLFLFNGLSYLVSAVTLLFVRISGAPAVLKKQHFLADLKDGLTFAWRLKGLRTMFFTASILNFFGILGIVLILPLFQKTPALGAARYGVTMACLTGGMMLGFLATGTVKVKPDARFRVFMTAAISSSSLLVAFSLVGRFPAMLAIGFAAGLANAVVNSFIPATVQAVVPADMIGKVSSLLMALSGGLAPLSMATAGILAAFIPIRTLMASGFGVMALGFTTLFFSRDFKKFICFNPAVDTTESLLIRG
jgi:MFS transporter, DHA3 family, macrolide efflux protein